MKSNLEKIKTELAKIIEARELATQGEWQKITCPSFFTEQGLACYAHGPIIYESPKKDRLERGWADAEFIALSANKITALVEALNIAVEALEFMTMPITSEYPTAESLLETLNNDTQRGQDALSSISKILTGDESECV